MTEEFISLEPEFSETVFYFSPLKTYFFLSLLFQNLILRGINIDPANEGKEKISKTETKGF